MTNFLLCSSFLYLVFAAGGVLILANIAPARTPTSPEWKEWFMLVWMTTVFTPAIWVALGVRDMVIFFKKVWRKR